MTTICKNCGNHFKGHYCFECGQAAATHKINSHFLWHDIQHGLFHYDKGLLYSARQLFTRPGATIREYIEGKRVLHLRPISMLVLLATVYGLLYHLLDISPDPASMEKSFGSSEAAARFHLTPEGINAWIGGHFALITLLQLPFYAIGSRIAFRKSGYNYVEHLVMNAFLAAQRLMVQLVILPIEYFYSRTETITYISGFTGLIDILLLVWGYVTFFHRYPTGKAIGLSIVSFLIMTVLAVALVLTISIIAGVVWHLRQHH